MAAQKKANNKNAASTHKQARLLPILLGISLSLNGIIILGLFYVILFAPSLPGRMFMYQSLQVMCSDDYKKDLATREGITKSQIAAIDYSCAKDNAQSYYMKGLENYRHSIGISE